MIKERFEITKLKKYYKFVYVCDKCGVEYGHDSIPLNKLCPFCERDNYNSKEKKKLKLKKKERELKKELKKEKLKKEKLKKEMESRRGPYGGTI